MYLRKEHMSRIQISQKSSIFLTVGLKYLLLFLGLSLLDIRCSSCQLSLATDHAAKICSMCKIALHDNDSCIVKYNNNIMCKQCFKRGVSDNRFFEEQARENWMGKNIPPKKRPRTSYLEPDDEMLMLNFSKITRATAIGLLRNGHLVHTNPLKIEQHHVTLRNTCSFDSVVQLLCVGYCDSKNFQLKVDSLSDNSVCKLLKTVINSGVAAAYRQRARILFNNFDHVSLPGDILCVHAESTLFNTIVKTFDNLSMATREGRCEFCKHNDITRTYFISVEVNEINQLEKSVLEQLSTKNNLICPVCTKRCFTYDFYLNDNFIIIEPVNVSSMNLELEISLDSIPKYIKAANVTFILRGIAGYVGISDPNYLGHFVAYGYRHNNKWVLYNDLLKKPEAVPAQRNVKCVMLFYTV